MEMVVLIIHLLVCICLIGLVLLQRSEGGALGMGGGTGSLMSGRGAADALAKMTSVAGGFFLVTSLGLTLLSGAAATGNSRSVFDIIPSPAQTAPAPAPDASAPAASEPARPDPTESSVTPSTQLAASDVVAPAPANAATRAMPLGPSSAAAATPSQRTAAPPSSRTGEGTVVPASSTARPPAPTPARTVAETPTPNRTADATTPAGTTTAERPLVLPNTSGGIAGINLTDDPAAQTESIQIGSGVEAVRRDQRAGPEQ